MQSRTSRSLVLSLLLTAVACAYQNAGAGTDNDGSEDDLTEDGGTSTGGTTGKAGSSALPTAGTQTTGSAGKATTGGKSTGGTTGKAGSSTGGKGGKGGSSSGGTNAGEGGEDTGPVNMPIVGLTVTFKADSTSDPVDFLGGELDVINDTAQPLSLADLKIRYYFSNEITAATPAVMMNWAQFGPKTNLGGATCTGIIAAAPSPKAGADSYVELSCTGANSSELTAGTLLKISWKAGAQGQGKFIQSDDYSFSDPTKIIVLNGSTIVWGVDPG
jgi:endoglucanase